MNLCLLTIPLLARGELLGTLGCAKQEDPTAKPTASAASYVLNGGFDHLHRINSSNEQ